MNRQQRQEERYRALLEGVDVGYFEVDLDGRYTFHNDAFCRIAGCPGEQLIGRSYRGFMSPETRARLRSIYNRIYRTGEPVSGFHYDRTDGLGRRKHIESSVSLIHDDNGAPIGFRGIVRDVTDRKRSEAVLRALAASSSASGEDIFRFLVKQLASLQKVRCVLLGRLVAEGVETVHTLAVWQTDGFDPNFNYDLAGTPCEHVVGQGTCFYPRRVQDRFPDDTLLAEMGAESYWGTPLKDSSGKVLGLLALLDDQPMDEDSETLALLQVFAMRAGAELERQKAEAERELLMTAVDQSGEMVVITERDGTIRFVNPSFSAITGYASDEALGQNPRILKSGHHDPLFYAELWETILDGRRWSGRLINRRKDGTLYTADCAISPVRAADGTIAYFIWIARDVTDHLALEKRLTIAQKMEAIGALSAGIAHDFNNILFPILGRAEMLLDEFDSGSRHHEDVAEIYKAARRAGELVSQILSFSRQAELKHEVVRIQAVLKEVLKMVRATIPANIKIITDFEPDCGNVLANPTHLHQIVLNLITNAYQAMPPEEGGAITIATKVLCPTDPEKPDTLSVDEAYVRLSVSDTGHGIASDTLGRIFDPFFTTKVPGSGTGLGLAVVSGIVKEYGGDIQVVSQVGHGTTFHVYLQLVAGSEETMPDISRGGRILGSGRILLVDDEVSIVRLLTQMLERLGYDVRGLADPLEAWARFRSDPRAFDLVITDMAMPGMTGTQLAGMLHSVRPDLPVILCTGFSEAVDAQSCEVHGIQGFLMKPVAMRALSGMVRRVLDECSASN
ncbi:PAS domain S-box protein [Desulfatitalea alkaliphila]|uniref:histidine kinase n=1 Tax=Desulfatitalea alkaliphila TaxID=2929485 RepID=A0AA41UKE7_9BACT|nr:PAS domain S-box protein [Desulfatitalea alkaliphila]MCJ8500356.1 PAS domain S-box protein [Desulfatitalea alkaliphila]